MWTALVSVSIGYVCLVLWEIIYNKGYDAEDGF